MNAPLRVPTRTRTPLIETSFRFRGSAGKSSPNRRHTPPRHYGLTPETTRPRRTGPSLALDQKELVAVGVGEPGRLLAPRHRLDRLLETHATRREGVVCGVNIRRNEGDADLARRGVLAV